MRSVYVVKGLRLFGFGLASIALPVHLAAAQVQPVWIGSILTLALVSGAAQMIFTGRLARWFGSKAIAIAAGLTMAAGGALTASGAFELILVAAAIGGLNASAQEIGPFLPLEQVMLTSQERSVHRMAWYNAIGTLSLALGTLAGGALEFRSAFLFYALCGFAIVFLYAVTTFDSPPIRKAAAGRHLTFGTAERIAALFGVDAFAGGLIVQGVLTYWFVVRFHVHPGAVAALLAAGTILSAFSLFAAAHSAKRFGLLQTMVFTHLPSNVLLALIPLAPTFPIAAALLLARYSLSQMDVPTRQAFVVDMVPEDERIYAAGITSAVRPVAAAASPLLSTLAMQTAALGVPFFAAGAIKACYDLVLYFAFRREARQKEGRYDIRFF